MSQIKIVTETGSTNDDVLELAQRGAEHGTAILALSQRKGRGRLGRSWHSPVGSGLYGSVLLRPRLLERRLYPLVTLLAGVAVSVAVEEETGLAPQLKWPNDLYLGDKKCGGILIETLLTSAGDCLVTGIGLNLSQMIDFVPEEVEKRAGALWPANHHRGHDPASLFSAIHRRLLALADVCERDGFAGILAIWRQRDGFYGRRLAWAGPDGTRIIGESAGIDDEGNLLLLDEEGHFRRINCGDVQPATA
jgi:BirA family biotin operon repressor/biotin-[acetyl-CoA-carboxylase] ligase